MGWTFPYSTQTRADLVRYLRRPERFGDPLQLVRACVTGSHHWYLVRERATGNHWIGLDLLRGGGRSGEGWGYKDLDESVGPCAVDCPLAYLAAPHTPRDGWAAQWRERVQAYHIAKKARPTPAPGAWVRFGGRDYCLVRPAGPRRGWQVLDRAAVPWRMPAAHLARAAFIAA